jgi:uncharacterized membrane protein (UPF0127 family)
VKGLFALAAVALLAAPASEALGRHSGSPLAGLPRSAVVVKSASGSHRFQVWIAADASSRERGLMFVRRMPADHGMLFLFDQPQFTSFWMKDTYLPLDLVFIRGDGTVSNIARDAAPGSLEPIPSSAPVIAVLELLGGTAAKIGLSPGDRVVLPDRAAVDGRDTRGGQRGK